MAFNRYAPSKILKGNVMASFVNVKPEELYSESDIFIKLRYSQRIDHVAYQYLGDGRYWWAICMMNGLRTPFDRSLVAGKLLRVPTSINKIIQVIESKKQ